MRFRKCRGGRQAARQIFGGGRGRAEARNYGSSGSATQPGCRPDDTKRYAKEDIRIHIGDKGKITHAIRKFLLL